MQTVSPYLELLKEELLDKCSATDQRVNKLRELKKGDFEVMSVTIQNILESSNVLSLKQKEEDINITISVSTLERLFKYGYVLQPMDKRILNTLNKLAWFLEYGGWHEFVEKKKNQFRIVERSIEEIIEEVVRGASCAEFEAYQALPEIKIEELKKYLIPTGSAYKRIYNILVRHNTKQWVINNKDNPSGHTTYELCIEKVSSKEAIVRTREYVYLRWYELSTEKYVHIYSEENTQTWKLIFEDGTWKVFSTYYPKPLPGSLT